MTEERLNRIEQKLTEIEQRVKTLELDMEPEGRISSGFEYLSNDLDSFREETRKRLERLEHGQNQIKASLATILERLMAGRLTNKFVYLVGNPYEIKQQKRVRGQ